VTLMAKCRGFTYLVWIIAGVVVPGERRGR
jgi:hypothetical protein